MAFSGQLSSVLTITARCGIVNRARLVIQPGHRHSITSRRRFLRSAGQPQLGDLFRVLIAFPAGQHDPRALGASACAVFRRIVSDFSPARSSSIPTVPDQVLNSYSQQIPSILSPDAVSGLQNRTQAHPPALGGDIDNIAAPAAADTMALVDLILGCRTDLIDDRDMARVDRRPKRRAQAFRSLADSPHQVEVVQSRRHGAFNVHIPAARGCSTEQAPKHELGRAEPGAAGQGIGGEMGRSGHDDLGGHPPEFHGLTPRRQPRTARPLRLA